MSETEKTNGESTAITVLPRPKRQFSLVPTTFSEAKEMANLIANSEFAPKDYRGKAESVLIAVQMGADLGLSPMQSLQNIAVINGRPAIWGDAALALVMPALQKFKESFHGDPTNDAYKAVCVAHRKGWPDETIREFSIADAKKANLWTKAPSPWQTYPHRMLQMRARGFCLRDCGADLLMGLVLAEEAGDYPDAITVTEFTSESVVSPLDKLEADLKASIEKGFVECKFTEGQRTVKVNEYLAGEKSPSEVAAGGAKLLDWLKDEYARQKTGQSRAPKAGDNAKRTNAPEGSNGQSKASPDAAGTGSQPGPAVSGSHSSGTAPASTTGAPAAGKTDEPVTAAQIPFGGKKMPPLGEGEIF